MTRGASRLLLGMGGATVGGALLWWGLAFWPPLANDYISLHEAGRCLLADSSLCRLATSLCSTRHALLVAAYPPVVLWAGVGAAFAGLTLGRHARATGRSAGRRRA